MTTIHDEWRAKAACKGRTDVMFLAVFQPLAKKLCADCPVLADCLTDALATEQWSDEQTHAGVRAGMTPNELINHRRRLRRNGALPAGNPVVGPTDPERLGGRENANQTATVEPQEAIA